MKIIIVTRKGNNEYEVSDTDTVKDLKKAFQKRSKFVGRGKKKKRKRKNEWDSCPKIS